MEFTEAIEQRHSVRRYLDRKIGDDIIAELQTLTDICNRDGDLHFQLVTDEPKAFDGFMAHYGKFDGVKNYIALVGKKSAKLDELCGYYGERLVIKAQALGLNTCWVAMTYKKISGAFKIAEGEKVVAVIAFGYGATRGVAHKSKTIEQVGNVSADTPEWFAAGVRAALLAPTAMNQQKFRFTYADGKVSAKAGVGFYSKVDLGIVKYHFELASGKKCE